MSVAPVPVAAHLPAAASPSEEIVQPSKEWVLPARGKPGRKPAAEVPLTKRKAQNRASQRAFRERRHAYLTELEEKVARYEAREIDANVQMQRIALQCREEANQLRQKNEALLARCEQLEQQVKTLAQPRADARLPSGCLPPKHESPPASDSFLPTHAPSPSYAPRPSPGSGAAAQTPTHTLSQLTSSLRHSDSPSDAEDIDLDCGFCPDQGLCVCRGKAQFELGDERLDTSASAAPTPSSAATPATPASAAVPLVRVHGHKSRLWPTTAASPAQSEAPTLHTTRVGSWAAAASLGLPRQRTSLAREPKRLWAVEPAPSAARRSSTSCTGNPRTCGACQEDPALAEFCSAVTRSVQVPTSTQRKTPAPPSAASPAASGSGAGAPPMSPSASRESIPHAFTRLRSHPNFGRWKGHGGLQMLAEVVSRDANERGSDSAESGSSSRGGGAPSAPSPGAGAGDGEERDAGAPDEGARTSATRDAATSPVALATRRSASDTSPDADAEQARTKRARQPGVYVRSDAVSEALAMLDRPGARSSEEETATSPSRPCPCPWIHTSSRLPWPR
ncbi:hypothetical protein MOBT1_001833 [Malassezia obtusa]|uniref:BZIP domain-containing protein n=1 Tax=Malassezia obtusa TaxID=76774 RepID=A0AAF0E009_9BASI|nr:hypothetical protein MOBT1_001833 [Malassezia obtusa]